MNDRLVKHMVDRFLQWKLPENFHPDAGISFQPHYNIEYMAKRGKPPMRHEPVGTNLFDAVQAEAMIRYLLESNPSNPTGSAPMDRCRWCGSMHAEHDVSRPKGAPVPRVPCGMLVSGFLPV